MSDILFEEYRLPACVSGIQRRPQPGSPFTAFLIGREIGIADSERAAYDVLNYLHRIIRLDSVFVSLDASHQLVGLEANHWWKGNFTRFRSFPDKRITSEIARSFLADSKIGAASAFGITAEPPVYIQALDDFHAWATAEDQLHSLSAAGGGIETVAALLESFSGMVDTDAVHLDLLLGLVRLQWSGSEWLQRQAVMGTLDPAQLLAPLAVVDGPLCARSVELVGDCKARAAEFYRCCQARVAACITKAVRQGRREHFSRVALLVDRSWFDHAAKLLATEGVTVVELRATAGSGTALLDRARVLLSASRGSVQLDDLFGNTDRRRTRIQALQDEEKDSAEKRCGRWILSAQGLEQEYQGNSNRALLEQALRCIDRALEIDPSSADAWSTKAYILYSRDSRADWHPSLERAMKLQPMTELHLLRLGHNLFRQGAHRPALRAFIHGIYRNSNNGALWNGLGNTLWALGRRAAACQCFHKAGDLGDPLGTQHFQTFCPAVPPGAIVLPWSVSRPVVGLMSKVVLPLRYRFGQNGQLALQLLTLAAAAVAGVFAGGKEAGVWGGLVGALTYTGAGVVLVQCTRRCVRAFASIGLKKAEQFDDLGEGGRRLRNPHDVSFLLPVSERTKALIGAPVVLVLVLAGSAFAAFADERSRALLAETAWQEVWAVAVRPLDFILGCLAAWLLLTRLAGWLMPVTRARRGQAAPLPPICAYCKRSGSNMLMHLKHHDLLVEPDCFAQYALVPAQQWSAPGGDGEACTLCHRSDSGATVATPIGRICARCTRPLLILVVRHGTDLSGKSVQQLMEDLLPTGEMRAKLAAIEQFDKVRAHLKEQSSTREGELLKRLVACLNYEQGHPLDETVRQAAQDAVVAAGPAVLPELLAAAQAESWQLRAHAVLALGRLAPDDPAVRDALRQAARDDRGEVRRHVVWVVLGQPAAWARELVRAFEGDPDSEVRAMVTPAITLLGEQT